MPIILICPFSDGKEAILEYRKVAHTVLDMFHTEVPPEHQGKGFAAQLVKVCSYSIYRFYIFSQEAFKYAKENNYKVIPSCSYVEKYAREMATQEERNLIEDGDRRYPKQ